MMYGWTGRAVPEAAIAKGTGQRKRDKGAGMRGEWDREGSTKLAEVLQDHVLCRRWLHAREVHLPEGEIW